VCFHARIAEEHPEERFDIDDVAGGIVAKLVHRHPHVFAGLEVAGVSEVEANWESLKTAEKGRSSALEGVPWALPALALAEKVVGRALRVGVDPAASGGPLDWTTESPVDTAAADSAADTETDTEVDTAAGSLGASLLGLVVEGRAAGVDPEQALRDAVRRLAREVQRVEAGGPGETRPAGP
jgi:XTP/dITP diphosphohydrolase